MLLPCQMATRRCLSVLCANPALASRIAPPTSLVSLRVRHMTSAAEVFKVSQNFSNLSQLPPLPKIPEALPTVEQLYQAGKSVLDELGLFSYWKPSGYFRWAIESIHLQFDLPWWNTIVCATIALRLALIYVPVMSQRLVAKQSKYRKELNEFRERLLDANKEGNNLLQQQIFIEQRDFMRSKGIRLGRQSLILLINGSLFATQFFAINGMVKAAYPGLSTGGCFWFLDLTAKDPYMALPLISAATMWLVVKAGIEMGTQMDQFNQGMRIVMQYVMPVMVFIGASRFPSAVCVYWCTSNLVSLLYAGLFRIPAFRKLFRIPPVMPTTAETKTSYSILKTYQNWKEKRQRPPTLEQLRLEDSRRFKKAGRNKPVIRE